MIQRIQSLYLLFAALALVLFAVLGVPEQTAFAGQAWLWWALEGLSGLGVLACIYAIVLYTDRTRQLRVVAAAQWLVVLVVLGLALVFVLHPVLQVTLRNAADVVGYLMPIVAYVLVRLAQRGIDRDIKLVKSMDRLR